MNELQTLLQALEVANKAGAYSLQDSVNVVTTYNALVKKINDLENELKDLKTPKK